MHNRDVAEMLDRAARILALRGENRYRVRAYKRAARAVISAPEEIEQLIRKNRLQSLEGVGSGLAAKIKEIVRTGKLPLLERLETGKLPPLEQNRQIMLASALTLVSELIPQLKELSGVGRVEVTGDVRRSREMVSEVAVVVGADDLAAARESFKQSDFLHQLSWDGNFCRAIHSYGIPVALYLVHRDDFCLTHWVTTGSKNHVQKVAAAIEKVTGHDLLSQEAKTMPHSFMEEEEIYELAEMSYVPPELREDAGELTAAAKGALPALITADQYRGDLHVHTDWSDGTADVEKMVKAAAELGYEYLAVTDHSRTLKIARGLSLERLAEQKKFIASLQEKYPNIRILAGIEADILDDGSVDAPDEVLSGLDVVVASVHSGFRQSRQKLTQRICRAMQNKYVQIIGHATGRLLGKRDPYDVDVEELIRTAAGTGTVLEINSSPDRLDINGDYARRAKETGVKIAINTDAHSQLELANVGLGIATARRGWLTAENVVNTRSASDLLPLLQRKKLNRQ
ncbi:PHP domain-containing protein [Dethiobacter alkaliphilus]|uniref:PHP domain protein n=1 Tax=Dethiobacter alkaliphilus AHT 1 TaxID=555088 RepID=C0GJM0_DETAL|nr:PHP domain-containing protein [Dethiobacter alkaliphilus]EEG76442.1 PHP domain protein [Dethiobacter alkaliphilus AHT 1]